MSEDSGEEGLVEKYFRDFSWVASGMFAAMIVDFVFYILAGRLMSPIEFGYFGVLTSLYYIFLRSPFRAIEITSKKLQGEGENSLNLMGRKSLYLGTAIFTLFVFLAYPLSIILDIPADSIIVFSLVFPFGYLLAVTVGKVQGKQNYSTYGKYELVSSFLAFTALLLVYLGFGAKGAVTTFIIEIIAGFLYLYRKNSFKLGDETFREYDLLKNSLVFILAIHLSFSVDLIAIQYLFSSEITGFYNTVAVLGKGLFFGAVAVNRSVFPKLVSDKANRIRNLQLSIILVTFGGVFSAIFFRYFGNIFIKYSFGVKYLQAAAYAPHYILMISGISLASLMTSYCLSTDKGYVKTSFLLPVAQFVLIFFFHETVLQIIYSTLLASLLIISIYSLIIYSHQR